MIECVRVCYSCKCQQRHSDMESACVCIFVAQLTSETVAKVVEQTPMPDDSSVLPLSMQDRQKTLEHQLKTSQFERNTVSTVLFATAPTDNQRTGYIFLVRVHSNYVMSNVLRIA